MPFVKRKSVEDLIVGKDMLFSKAGNIANAGSIVTDTLVQRFLRNKVPIVTVLCLTKEEATKGIEIGAFEEQVLKKEAAPFNLLRYQLFECAKRLYKPFSEMTNKAFWGKLGEKMIKKDFLLDRRPDLLYKNGIYEGSASIFSTSDANRMGNDQKKVLDILGAMYESLESMEWRGPDEPASDKTIPRLFLDSIRMCTIFDAESKATVRILDPGNALAWHATDTAVMTLYALTNMSLKRHAAGLPESKDEFSSSRTAITSHHTIKEKAERFWYPRDTILHAALGCFLHSLGYAHTTVSQVVSRRPMLDDSVAGKEALKLIRKGQYVVRNLFAERDDVSAIAKKVINQMKQYPDGRGYPLIETPGEGTIPEYARMANIIDDFDELTTPILNPLPLGRMDALAYIKRRSGQYHPGKVSATYDKILFDEFIQVLKPYEANERVDLYLGGKQSKRYYCGFVRSYALTRECLPQICILKNAIADESYQYGRLVFDLEGGHAFLLDESGKTLGVYKRNQLDEKSADGQPRIKNPKIREMLRNMADLIILDEMKAKCLLADFSDPVYDVSKASKG